MTVKGRGRTYNCQTSILQSTPLIVATRVEFLGLKPFVEKPLNTLVHWVKVNLFLKETIGVGEKDMDRTRE